MTDRYDEAVQRWVASKIGASDWQNVSGVEFDMGADGYCDTCYSEYVTISYSYSKNGKGNRSGDIGSIRYDSPATMIREMAELALLDPS